MADEVELDHWIYGSILGKGYTVKATSRGLNLGLYEQRVRSHYVPVRAATAQGEDVVDFRLVHPVGGGREILLSRVGRGPPDEDGRPTFANHTVVAPAEPLRSGRLSFDLLDAAAAEFDRQNAGIAGEVDPLRVAMRDHQGTPAFGAGLRRQMTLAAAETLASRLLGEPHSRTLLLCRNTTPEARIRTLYLLLEALHLAGGLPLVVCSSEAPTASTMNDFQLVVAPRGVRADNTWMLLDSSLEAPALKRVAGHEALYKAIERAFAA